MARTVAIGSDHAGFHLKTALVNYLTEQGYQVIDAGTDSDERVDYPRFGAAVAKLVAAGEVDRGVLVCGSGQGVCMAANKVAGARAGVVRDSQDAEMIRRHNDANIACFGERVTDAVTAVEALAVFLDTEFEGGRHQPRVDQLAALDRGENV
ncbi:MAG: ribose 5-phosphate isomerase B [Actinomycetota bacterium]|nr:ribose 5-phosphate isomerase B [Actinomycetota bacterium]